MTSYDQHKEDKFIIQDIHHLSDQEQANKLADHFAEIPNSYNQINKEYIDISPIKEADIPQFKPVQVWMILSHLKVNKSTVPGDIPVKLFKEFSAHLAHPLTEVFNSSLIQGVYPNIYKFEVCPPVPKKYPVEKIEQMRNISGLLTSDKVFEKLLSELIISDMREKIDISQYGNEKETSIQHYLIKMIHRIHTALDKNSRREIFAVVATFVDWNSAFVRHCPKLGIISFQKNGVRNSIIPLLISYF